LNAMKGHTRQLLELAVVYLVVLVVVDSILTAYPVLTWLALGIAFIVFSLFILDVLLELTPKKVIRPVQFQSRGEDELMNLEKLTKHAIDEGHPEAATLLSEKLKSIALRAAAYRTNMSDAQLIDMARNQPDLLAEWLQDREIVKDLITDDQIVKPREVRRLQEILSIVESWLP